MTQFKRGATFNPIFTADMIEVDGITVADLTGWTARCTLRTTEDAVVEELAATIIDPVARKIRLLSAGTAVWPKGRVQGDVWAIGPGGAPRIPTVTFAFDVIDGPTRWI